MMEESLFIAIFATEKVLPIILLTIFSTMLRKFLLFYACLIVSVQITAQTGHFYSSDQFSSGLISSLCQDHKGSIWIGTDYGLNKFDGYHFGSYFHDENQSGTLGADVVSTVYCDRSGRVWVGTNRGLDRYDEATESFIHYTFPNGYVPRVSSIMESHDGTLFFGTAGYGLYTLGGDNQLHTFDFGDSDEYFSNIFEDSQGRIWKSGFNEMAYSRKNDQLQQYRSEVGTIMAYVEHQGHVYLLGMHGLMIEQAGKLQLLHVDMSELPTKDVVFSDMIIGPDNNIYIGTRGQGVWRLLISPAYKLEQLQMNSFGIDLNTTRITSMLFDRRGNLWLGCHRKGLVLMPQKPTSFNTWSFMAQGLQLGSTISSVCEGDDGMVWCTVQGVGIYGFNSSGRVVAHPSAPEAVEFIFRDRQKRFWVGTDDALFSYDPLTGRSKQEVTFDCDRFNDMTSDEKGNIYISTFSRGFCVYNSQTHVLKNHHFGEQDSLKGRLCNNWVMGMTVDKKGLLWLATSSGVACYNPQNESFRSLGWESQLDGIVCFDVCELQSGSLADGRLLNGCIAIGTEQGLYLYDPRKGEVERFPGSEVLKNKVVCYVIQSNNGDLWCSTSQGIWQRSGNGSSFVGHVNGNGLTQREYLYGVGMHVAADDGVFFGHSDGLTMFYPNNVRLQRERLDSVQLSAFMVSGQLVNASTVLNDVRVTDRPVSESSYFTLSYLDHTVTMSFSQFNFDNPMNVAYEYRLDGGRWIQGQEGQNSFTLSHLQPGTYRMEVRACVGTDYSPVKVIVLTIKAPWYRSTTAKLLYLLLVVLVGVYIYSLYRRRTAAKLNEDKMKFLINATHDIRSPLTLIMAPLEKIKRILNSSEQQQPALLQSVEIIERNAQRILNLVNQILDVRKIDKNQMHLHCSQVDLVTFASGICKMFEYNARERNITFIFDSSGLTELQVWIDGNQFDKVITNLLSNAFKYTQEGGTITLRLKTDGHNAYIEVIDTGMGLDPGSEKHLFDRFYQGKNSRTQHINGTGIGLNLCKMIVDMHHGTIEAHNRQDGQRGSVFTVGLLLGNSHLSVDDLEMAEEVETLVTFPKNQKTDGMVANTVPEEKRSTGASGRHRILIVDDDEEIGRYIASELSNYYKFSFCSNGKEGLSELLASADENRSKGEPGYDLVISDVMMPEMDGFTMLRMIKNNMNISHIPVIMLTSKADVGNRLEGLERGADAFLAKPFSMDELHFTIDNLIKSRQRLKGKFSGAQQQADKIEQPEVKGNDEQLMERIMKSVNKNLSDSDFSVETLTQEVGISRAQLHRKMKEMTGLSTSEFIRNIRLEQAARLLREQKINVTQVAYTVGFSNLAHFSTIFRKHFGVSPSEYIEKNS